MQQYKVYDLELGEKKKDAENPEYIPFPGEIGWYEHWDQIDLNHDETELCREEVKYLLFKMNQSDDWIPGKLLQLCISL